MLIPLFWRNYSSFKQPLNTHQENTSTTQHAESSAAMAAVPDFWELEALLQ
jgi:hypothetical protein